MSRRFLLTALRLFFAVLAGTAIARQLQIHVQMGFSPVNFFSYFTNLSNAFAVGVLLFSAWWPATAPANTTFSDRLRGTSVVNMAVVGIVFAALLRNVDLGSLLPWVNFVLHYVMPCVVVLDWLLQAPATRLGTRQLLLVQVFPMLYLGYVLVRGSSTGWYPYPFLNPANVDGYGGVGAYALGIALTFLLAGWVLFALGNKLGKSADTAAS